MAEEIMGKIKEWIQNKTHCSSSLVIAKVKKHYLKLIPKKKHKVINMPVKAKRGYKQSNPKQNSRQKLQMKGAYKGKINFNSRLLCTK